VLPYLSIPNVGTGEEPPPSEEPPKRRRRWALRLLIAGVAFGALVLGPALSGLANQGPGGHSLLHKHEHVDGGMDGGCGGG